MRLCSGAAIFMGLGGTYALWSSVAIWMVGALAAFIAGALVYAAPTELCRPRKRFLSGGNRIALTQHKTNKRIWVPCHERLRRVLNSRLAEMPPERLAFL